jgi:hypothetical protein
MSINYFRLPVQFYKQTDQDVERLVDEILSRISEFIERRYGEGVYKKIFMFSARTVLTVLILMLDSIISQMSDQMSEQEEQAHEQRVQ